MEGTGKEKGAVQMASAVVSEERLLRVLEVLLEEGGLESELEE